MDGRDLQRGAEDGFLQGDGDVGDDVVAVAVEAGVGGDGDLDQCIAGGGAVEAGAALAAQAQDVAVLGAGGNADVQRLAVGQREAAGGAGGGIDEADGQRVLHVAATHGMAGGTPVGALAGSAERLGEESFQVFLAEPAAGGFVAFLAGGVAVVLALLVDFMALGVDLAAVEAGALVLVGQQVVGRTDLAEAGGGVGLARVDVGVVLLRQLAIGGADGCLIGGALDAKDFVWVFHRCRSRGDEARADQVPVHCGSRLDRKASMPSAASRASMLRVMTSDGVVVGGGEGHLGLAVEGFLADGDGQRAFGGDLGGQGPGGGWEVGFRDDAVDQAELAGAVGWDQVAGQQHLHRGLAADGSGQGDHRGGAEQADVDARRGEAGGVGGDGEVGGGDQLAAGGGGDAVDLGDDRLGQVDDALHQAGAEGEDVLRTLCGWGWRGFPAGRGRRRRRGRWRRG